MRSSETTNQLFTSLIAARQAFKPILRDASAQIGQSRSYTFAPLNTILDAVMPALLANNLMLVQVTDADDSALITRLSTNDGQWIEASYRLDFALPPQSIGSQISYARRYCISALLCLSSEDDDAAAAQQAAESATSPRSKAGGRIISKAQVDRLWAIAGKRGWSDAAVKDYLVATYHVNSSKEIRQPDYDGIIAHLERGPAPAVPQDDQPF
jgi:hypothetical protein